MNHMYSLCKRTLSDSGLANTWDGVFYKEKAYAKILGLMVTGVTSLTKWDRERALD